MTLSTHHEDAVQALVSEGYRVGGFNMAVRGLAFWGLYAIEFNGEGYDPVVIDDLPKIIHGARSEKIMAKRLVERLVEIVPGSTLDLWDEYKEGEGGEVHSLGLIPDAWKIEISEDGPILTAVEVVRTHPPSDDKIDRYQSVIDGIIRSDAKGTFNLKIVRC